MLKLLIGGSPCTNWSIAKKEGRETEPSGIGWELFKNYIIAREKFAPDFFVYENVAYSSPLIKEAISDALGVDLLRINSALVSAQNRDRIYGVNAKVDQPADRGILLRDILESGVVDREKSYALKHQQGNTRDYFKKRHTQIAFEPIITHGGNKSNCLRASYGEHAGARNFEQNIINSGRGYDGVIEPIRIGTIENDAVTPEHDSKQYRVYSPDAKSTALCGQGGGVGAKTGLYAVPLNPIESGKARTITAGYANKGDGESSINSEAFSNNKHKQKSDYVAEPVPMYHYPHGFNAGGIQYHDKSMTIPASAGAICNHGIIETYRGRGTKVYEVSGGQIEINGTLCPINLADGLYIIRKLTVTECCRLQTLPDDYRRAVSATQGYKGLGNGWTAEVIIHIMRAALAGVPRTERIKVLSMYDGIGTGLYCLKALGFENIEYHAYEIDKYAMTVANSNHPEIMQRGDAFAVRNGLEI